MPIARTGTREEAQSSSQKDFSDLGLQTETISDEELGISESNVIRVRSVLFDDEQILVRASGRAESSVLKYTDLILLVQARILIKTTTVKERQSRGAENEILDASEFYSDQFVVDLYSFGLRSELANSGEQFRLFLFERSESACRKREHGDTRSDVGA